MWPPRPPVVAALAPVAPAAAVAPARVRAVPPASPPAVWNPAAVVAPVARPTVPWLSCDAMVGGFCAPGDQGPAPTLPAPCSAADDRAIPGADCAGVPPIVPPERCPLPDDRVCVAER
jgi:hypothetical protein